MATFKLSVFTDEITHDFGRACEIATNEFRVGYVELRAGWGKNIMAWDDRDIREARAHLEKNRLRVTSIAGPLFKTDFPGAPVSSYSHRDRFGADFAFEQQPEVLERGLELARAFATDRLRCFDFWRLDDQKPFRAQMNQVLNDAAATAAKRNIKLVMENEYACNTATGAEAVETLAGVKNPNFMLNWDPGNAAFRDEIAYPNGYDLLPKNRIGHVHCKDAGKNNDGSHVWMKMGAGTINYVEQFRALKKDGYRGAVVLETHWRGAVTPEASTRASFAGMKAQLQQAGAL